MDQRTSEWLEWRRKGIGSSDAAVIMDESPYMTRYQLWQDKMGLLKQGEENIAMRRGSRFESNALAWINLEEGLDLTPMLITHENNPVLRASLDGYDMEDRVMTEIKYIGNKKFDEIIENQVPIAHHYVQIQHQLAVSNALYCWYVFFTLSEDNQRIDRIDKLKIKPDAKYQKSLLEKEYEFWITYVEPQIAPPLSKKDVKIYDESELELFSAAEELIRLTKESEEIERKIEGLEIFLKAHVKHPKVQIGKVTLNKIFRKGSINYSKINVLQGLDLEPYRNKGSEYITIKIEKEKLNGTV